MVKNQMIDFENIYQTIASDLYGNLKKLSIHSSIGIYYGMSKEGFLRIGFMSKSKAPKLESTKTLKVTQGAESENTYWTYFDLVQSDAQKVFFAFCANLVEAIENIDEEQTAMKALKKRYIMWKSMFKRDIDSKISREALQGLFGELYFLNKHMIEEYGVDSSIYAWAGPDSKSKDFSVSDTWYEIKTVGANTQNVHISSLAQLSSNNDGHLVIIRVESMSKEYEDGESSVGDLFKCILSKIDNEIVESEFLSKLSAYGFDSLDESFMATFSVKSLDLYMVDEKFPRITEKDIQRAEICDVGYSIIINALNDYKEE